MEKIYYEPSKIFKNASAADSKDEHYVYRYEPKVYFEENISKKRLMFSSLTNWDDRLEARYLQYGKSFLKKTAVALCFTTNAQTNEAAAWGMHKKFSDKPYVQIRYNLDHIVKGLRTWAKKFKDLDPEIFIENVKYKEFKEHREKSKNLNQKKFDTRLFADLLLLKRLDFQFEGEVRILIIANQELLKQPEQNLLEVYLGESLKKACNRIRFEPFSAERVKSNEKLPKPKDDYDIVKMKDFVSKKFKGRTDIEVQRSRLYEYGPIYDIRKH